MREAKGERRVNASVALESLSSSADIDGFLPSHARDARGVEYPITHIPIPFERRTEPSNTTSLRISESISRPCPALDPQ